MKCYMLKSGLIFSTEKQLTRKSGRMIEPSRPNEDPDGYLRSEIGGPAVKVTSFVFYHEQIAHTWEENYSI